MGFKKRDLPKTSQLGSVISSILTFCCGGSDPLLTLSSYLNCLTRRTPRTTGELVSFFHDFGIELHETFSHKLLLLGMFISNLHDLTSTSTPNVVYELAYLLLPRLHHALLVRHLLHYITSRSPMRGRVIHIAVN
ncbi:hypothetical protein BBBOND_0202990 [Babesia bigemina]|uniref:Uncharacterized protein n=1 Tax=Babesia bigemina TaxID=5866 RepID=A0A061D520_BABBI|nr:hypothetical protein BBBOND_0202990 [Babesia bigemina]CDR95142.1 hypothetical protein BBBOND_0202990 [Babesia bigemina]|eukprot:XP_012767328.1 hypothetical protein BBBOND_0202990 [Babesia bigemina]